MQVLQIPKAATLWRSGVTVAPASLSEFNAEAAKKVPYHLPIYRALLAGDISLCQPRPAQALPMAKIKTCGTPVIVHICDDGPLWLGPDGWACASFACDWAKAIMVNGSGGETEYYASAVEKALEFGRVAIVDCDSDHFDAWRICAAVHGLRKPILAITARPGLVHPVDREP